MSLLEPKIAVATTTIRTPEMLKLLHAHAPEVAFFVAGDTNTPEQQVSDLVKTLGANAYYLSVENQKRAGYACSDLIGWACIQRRSIAILESLKWGADIIICHDDDNAPMNESYFDSFVSALHHPFNGIAVSGYSGWFDVGQLLDPVAGHRGFPVDAVPLWQASTVVGAKVGIAAGICMGDPDVSAVTRLANRAAPLDVHRCSALLDAGIVVRPSTQTVFNSQNSSFIRELAPAAFLMPGIGRHDDIWQSLIMQRVMRERNMHVHFGKPFIFQQRNPHNLIRDLKDEMLGMEHTREFADVLDNTPLAGISVLVDVDTLVDRLAQLPWMPTQSIEAYYAWLQDIEKII